ncbi:MAG: ABC transporter substrate-binding protein [Thermoanaerobaculia bacterium]
MRFFSTAVPLVAALAVTGCGPTPQPVAKTPQRVIAVAPAVVESLFALGAGDRIVGVGNYAHWPPQVEDLPRIGGLYDPRFETIAALEPDLAILVPSEAELAAALETLGVEVLIVPHESIADVERALETIANRLGIVDRAEPLIEEIRSALRAREPGLEVSVLLSVARQPGRGAEIYAAGEATFLGELLSRLGASNVTAGSQALYPRLGFEEAVVRAPEVVLELQPEPVAPEAVEAWRRDWRTVTGDRTPCVAIVDGSHVLLPGPRLPQLYRDLEAALRTCIDASSGAAG